MPLIRECIVTTVGQGGRVHMAPLGLIEEDEGWILAPFAPSGTLDNLRASRRGTVNFTDDARIFAGCVTGRRDWPLVGLDEPAAPRLAAALAHAELEVTRIEEDAQRPRFHCRVVRQETHAPFLGMNRARAAVLEGAILATRLSLLPREKIESEMAYLAIAIDKTAGENERRAWRWITDKIDAYYARR
ncbi:MAG: DUF447 family protein [Hyphomicrobiales bacterium]|nr:DUF447 family protein [Hyphomicrobiales bacterium]